MIQKPLDIWWDFNPGAGIILQVNHLENRKSVRNAIKCTSSIKIEPI